ncbi:J domain-containing protein [Slackia isoflavoniconvertens]|uniref:J domain-containing protein n=1 Tax=Slackia isoflavoniconvertens TaxID=572010 RepID=A0A3N0I8W8_9ACTN|nr:J domain-containing protein [Slackia isoflavoniconvertens]MBB3279866.1 curved DNA-binding protein CbpA [Slackia isoflavoniconvertens]RNM32940.1 hypothetical protein DMP05_09220 [Slackia isoflavoniconvertens]
MNLSEAEDLFGLSDGYTTKEVNKAHRRLAMQYHPDLNENSQASVFFMRQINEAKTLLEKAASHESQDYRQPKQDARKQKQSNRDEEAERRRRAREADETARQEASEEARRKQEERKRRAREAERQKAEQQQKEKDYLLACEMSLKVKTSEAHARVAERFKKLGDYKDAKIYVASHEAAAEKLRVIEAEQNKKTRRYGFLTACLTVATTGSLLFFMFRFAGAPGVITFLFFGGWLPPMLSITCRTGKDIRDACLFVGGALMVDFVSGTIAELIITGLKNPCVMACAGAQIVTIISGRIKPFTPAGIAGILIMSAVACVLLGVAVMFYINQQ